MKVPDNPPPSQAAPASTPSDSAASGPGSFDKVMRRKAEDAKSDKKRPLMSGLGDDPGSANAAVASAPFLDLLVQAPAAAGTPALAPAKQLDGLAQEIVVHATPGVEPKVELQFQSTTLDGLNVRITRKGDEISIRFLTGSDSVAQLLAQNSGQLSQALSAKGLQVAPIRVELSPTPARSTDSSPQSGSDRGGQGERQQKRQR